MTAALSTTYFKTFRAALKGDDEAIQALFWWAKASLESGKLPSKGLNRFVLRIITDQNLYAKAIKIKDPPKNRGRPSIDDRVRKKSALYGFKFKKFENIPRSKKYAMIVAYLLSEGYLINEVGTKDKESSVEYLSTLTGLSWRSLQTYYYKYKATLIDNPDALEIGKIELMRLKKLNELRKKRSSQ
jgi:hypothetical protein